MTGAGLNPVPDRVLRATVSTNFFQAFLAVTNPVGLENSWSILTYLFEVFAYAGKKTFLDMDWHECNQVTLCMSLSKPGVCHTYS